ncbi:MAG: hypothetical protein F6K44_00995 [Moorea sp. SIO3E2]|nr:hypothetical protein [Moorena sp. SIO3E2]
MNVNIRKLLDAIGMLRDIPGCELEVSSLSHKAKAMYSQGKEGKEGIPFIDCCTDEELIAAVQLRDERLGLYPFIDPTIFVYIKKNRPKVFRYL